jgi:hypothetical protein
LRKNRLHLRGLKTSCQTQKKTGITIPLQVVTWILKDVYISGTEFTMNGKKMRLEKVETPVETETSDSQEGKETKKEISEEAAQNNKGAKVISLEDLKRK